VKPACNSLEDAKSLPPAVFKCDKVQQTFEEFLSANVDCRSTYSDQNSCDADAGCSWCTSGAVKPACNSLEDAKSLPPAVFKCDKVQTFEQYMNPVQATCGSFSDDSSCDAVAECTWCKSAAVKSSCKSIDDAKSLPSSIFSCDKLQEFPPMRDERHHHGHHDKKPIADQEGSVFEGYLDAIRGKHAQANGQCDSFADADSCDAVSDCTWCKSAAVKSSCKSIDDAKSLPASIFSCDKLQEEDGLEFMKGLYGDDLRSAFKYREQTEDDEEEEDDDEDRHHHHHDRHHHPKHGCCVMPLLVLGLIAAHMYFLYKVAHCQRQVKELGGDFKGERKCGKKEKKVAVSEQSTSLNESTNHVLEYSICDHIEQDKEGFPEVIAPTATHYLIEKSSHNMV